MASIVLTAVGTAIGGPIGGAIGGLLGRSIDRAIFGGGSQNFEGNRLKDLTVQTSSYGEPVARVYGTMRLPGNVVWSSGLKEHKSEETQGGGKGSGSVTQTRFTYSASFAVALSAREVFAIGRVWADGKLLRDAAGVLAVSGSMRFYNGSAFQAPDPLIEAVEGVNNVNAFQDLAYVVFEDLALAEYANRIPNLTFEIIADEGGAAALSTIVADICALSRVPSCDVSDLVQMVGGYMIAGPMKSRAAIEELAQIYHFDVIEQEDSLLFRRLDREALVTIAADDIVQPEGQEDITEKFTLTRRQDMELPREVSLSFIDPARDYQTGHQRARRLNVASEIVLQTAHPLVISANEAKAASEIQLDMAWLGRETARFTLPHKYADLLPGDVVSVLTHNGPQDFLISELEMGQNGLRCQAMKFSSSLLVNNSATDSGYIPPQIVELPADSLLFPLDMPSLGAEQITIPLFFWMVGAGSGKWNGAGLFISRDNDQTYSQIDFASTAAVAGMMVNSLSSGPVAYWDEGNDCLVALDDASHSLSGVTAEEVLNGANIAWIGGEIIQFREASLEPDGRYRLRGLLRGRRGTERYVDNHGANETFILLDPQALHNTTLNMTDIGLSRQFKAVTSGQSPDDVTGINHSFSATVLRPFSPVHARAQRDGSGTLSLSWIRRSRVGGDWMDNADVPLGETYEKYDVEILNGVTVVRTVTTDSPGFVYSDALQISDFGSVQATITVRISQLSDVVGRGWPLTVSL